VQRAQMPRAADGVEPLDLEQDGLGSRAMARAGFIASPGLAGPPTMNLPVRCHGSSVKDRK